MGVSSPAHRTVVAYTARSVPAGNRFPGGTRRARTADGAALAAARSGVRSGAAGWSASSRPARILLALGAAHGAWPAAASRLRRRAGFPQGPGIAAVISFFHSSGAQLPRPSRPLHGGDRQLACPAVSRRTADRRRGRDRASGGGAGGASHALSQ